MVGDSVFSLFWKHPSIGEFSCKGVTDVESAVKHWIRNLQTLDRLIAFAHFESSIKIGEWQEMIWQAIDAHGACPEASEAEQSCFSQSFFGVFRHAFLLSPTLLVRDSCLGFVLVSRGSGRETGRSGRNKWTTHALGWAGPSAARRKSYS